jgi:hypothetical protein
MCYYQAVPDRTAARYSDNPASIFPGKKPRYSLSFPAGLIVSSIEFTAGGEYH